MVQVAEPPAVDQPRPPAADLTSRSAAARRVSREPPSVTSRKDLTLREPAPGSPASQSHARWARTPGPNSDDGGRSRWNTSASRRRTHGRLVLARITPAM